MDNVRKSKQTHSLTLDGSSPESLKETVKLLTQRTKTLERYKALCEERIKELYPNHPFPVKEEHLGNMLPVLSELQQARQRIAKLELQIHQKNSSFSEFGEIREQPNLQSKYNEIVKEKILLEESLRAEMLSCEEQRTYIEILKQALEESSEDLKFHEADPGELKEKLMIKAKSVDIKRDFANLKTKVMDQESQIDKIKRINESKDVEIESINKEKEALETHLKQAAEALQMAEDEVIKLEEEKNSLLDYIDEQTHKEQDMEKEMNELAKMFEEMKENYKVAMEKCAEETENKEKNEKEIQTLHDELMKSSRVTKELERTTSTIKNKLEEKEVTLRKIKEEKIAFEIKCESLLANVTTLNETLKETQNEMESNLLSLNKKLSKKEEELEKLKRANINLNEDIDLLKKESKATIKEKGREIEELLRKNEDEKIRSEDYKSKINALENKLKSCEEDKKALISNEKIMKQELLKMTEFCQEYMVLKNEYIDIQQKEKIQAQIVEELRSKNNEQAQEIDRLYQENSKTQAEILSKSQELDMSIRQIAGVTIDCNKLRDENRLLERLMTEEKNNFHSFKELIANDKELLERKMNEYQQRYEESERMSKETMNYLTEQIHIKDSIIKSDESSINSIKDELQLNIHKLESKEIEYSHMQSDIADMASLISYNLSNIFSNFASLFPSDLEIYLKNLKNCSQDVLDYIHLSSDWLKFLSEIVFDLRNELNNKNYELSMAFSRLEGLNAETDSYKSQLRNLTQQLDMQIKEKDSIKHGSQELNSLIVQVESLKSDINKVSEENYKLKASLQQALNDNHGLKVNSEILLSTMKTQEQANRTLKTEKNELENLLSLTEKEQNYEKSCREAGLLRDEMEILERERLNIECQLMKLESDPRAKEGVLFRELGQKLLSCQRLIQSNKRSMQFASDEMVRNESTKRYRRDFRTNQHYLNSLNSYCESPPNRERSLFK